MLKADLRDLLYFVFTPCLRPFNLHVSNLNTTTYQRAGLCNNGLHTSIPESTRSTPVIDIARRPSDAISAKYTRQYAVQHNNVLSIPLCRSKNPTFTRRPHAIRTTALQLLSWPLRSLQAQTPPRRASVLVGSSHLRTNLLVEQRRARRSGGCEAEIQRLEKRAVCPQDYKRSTILPCKQPQDSRKFVSRHYVWNLEPAKRDCSTLEDGQLPQISSERMERSLVSRCSSSVQRSCL